MPSRENLIRQIEGLRGSRLICYITGDRRGLETKIASEVLPLFYDQLREIGQVKKIDLFLYTAGGDSLAGWGLVNLLREYCQKLGVIIPFKALSCGTLISLGANEIIMSKAGQLSPIDPSLASPYNPQAPGQGQPGPQLLPVSVEDVIGYLKLVREEVGIRGDEGLGEVIKILSEKVHPLALGAVYRSREQMDLLARKLLSTHENDSVKIDKIVVTLSKKLPSHQYLIHRKEAGDLGLKIIDPTSELEPLMYDLYKAYEELLKLNTPYNREEELGANQSTIAKIDRAIIESLKQDNTLRTHVYRTEREIKRVSSVQPGAPPGLPPILLFQERNISEGWKNN